MLGFYRRNCIALSPLSETVHRYLLFLCSTKAIKIYTKTTEKSLLPIEVLIFNTESSYSEIDLDHHKLYGVT